MERLKIIQEIRTCACGCGDTFVCKIHCESNNIIAHHLLSFFEYP